MNRLALLSAVSALLVAPSPAQQRLDSSRLYPITAPVRHAGTVDVTTGRWTRAAAVPKGGPSGPLYTNTCTWAGGTGQAYGAADWCEEVYDEGRIPSPSSPMAPAGAQTLQDILSFEVTYCTFSGPQAIAGGYDMDVAFWDKLGGDCAGTVPPTPPAVSSTATAYFPLAGLGLPGSTAVGFQACWIVTIDTSNTGFVLASDGEGTFNGNGADDKFVWMQRQNTTVGALNLPGTPDGFFIAGEPATGGYGACSFSIPCGVDAFTGSTCGTGLDTFDAMWINVDGIGVGGTGQPAGCANTIAQYGYGTNCYFFGGYPSNPLASYWLVLEGELSGCALAKCTTWCVQTKPTSVPGCTVLSTVTDLSLANGIWSTTKVPRHSSLGTGTVVGLYLYTHGVGIGQSTFAANIPFGLLCLTGTTRSGPAVLPNAQGGICNLGTMDVVANALPTSPLAVGEDVNFQFWYRDPLPTNPGNANFGNGVFYTVQ